MRTDILEAEPPSYEVMWLDAYQEQETDPFTDTDFPTGVPDSLKSHQTKNSENFWAKWPQKQEEHKLKLMFKKKKWNTARFFTYWLDFCLDKNILKLHHCPDFCSAFSQKLFQEVPFHLTDSMPSHGKRSSCMFEILQQNRTKEEEINLFILNGKTF